MSLDRAIENGKEYRNPYRGAKAVDHTCRNHGTCPWCQGNRHYKHNKRMLLMDDYDEEELDFSDILRKEMEKYND